MRLIYVLILMISAFAAQAQNDPEYPKEFIMHLRLHNGMITNFHQSPDAYTGGLQIVPQYTVVPHLLRAGLIGDVFYAGKKLQLGVGPTISIKLKTLKAKPFGSVGNISLNLEHIWATEKEKLAGGGLTLDLANKIIIGLSAHRDYAFNTWWFQNTLAFRISKVKKTTPVDL